MPTNWEQRDRKLTKRKNGMRVSNTSIFTVRDANAKRDREKVERSKKPRKGRDVQ